MILIEQPNRWSCLPTAFAMALSVPLVWLIKQVGHDGSQILYPDSEEPMNRRCFHIQEMIDIAYKHGYSVMPIEAKPRLGKLEQNIDIGDETKNVNRLIRYLTDNIGVITGKINNKKHAVAWNKEMIYDPNGTIYPINRFTIETFHMINKIRNRESYVNLI